jgi:toxin YoeB
MPENWRRDLDPIFLPDALAEYKSADEKTKSKINALIISIYQDGLINGLGKPEKLRHRPEFSRRITKADRLIYDVGENGELIILSCVGHYE